MPTVVTPRVRIPNGRDTACVGHVGHTIAPTVVWTHSNDSVVIHTHLSIIVLLLRMSPRAMQREEDFPKEVVAIWTIV